MNRDTYITFSHSVRILKAISADRNWVWILSGNLNNLSTFAPIPFINDSYDIKIKLCDIEKFAVDYLVGLLVVSAEDIASIIDKECAIPVASDQELDKELDDLLGGLTSPSGSFMNAIPDTDGNIQLGRAVVESLRHALMNIADVQDETCCTLKTLAMALSVVEYSGELSSEEAEVLSVVATAMWERARDSVVNIRSIIN